MYAHFVNPVVSSSKPVDSGGSFLHGYQVKWRRKRTDLTNVIHPDTGPRKLPRHILLVLQEYSQRYWVTNGEKG